MSAIVAISKGDLTLEQRFQTAVDQRDAEDVSSQIVEDLCATTGMAAMDVPLLLPTRILGVEPTQSLQAGLELGANAYITKPFTPEKFQEKLSPFMN